MRWVRCQPAAQCECDDLFAIPQVQPLEDFAHMVLDGVLADAQRGPNLLVRQPFGYQDQDLALAGRQVGDGRCVRSSPGCRSSNMIACRWNSASTRVETSGDSAASPRASPAR